MAHTRTGRPDSSRGIIICLHRTQIMGITSIFLRNRMIMLFRLQPPVTGSGTRGGGLSSQSDIDSSHNLFRCLEASQMQTNGRLELIPLP